jgi:hypothetical protein
MAVWYVNVGVQMKIYELCVEQNNIFLARGEKKL